MSGGLYTLDVLRLATSLGDWPRLASPQSTAEKRSVVCGSRVTVDIILDDDDHVIDFGQDVQACALGQASAALLAAHIVGCSAAEVEQARVQLAAFLAGKNEEIGDWPGIDVLKSVKSYPARHASIRLPFEAASEAARLARTA